MNIDQRTDYDSEFCGSIPLNFINLIQAYGILLVIDKNDLLIRQISQNFEQVTGLSAQEVLDKPLSDFVDPAYLLEIKNKVAAYNVLDKIPIDFGFKTPQRTIEFSSTVHFKDDYILMEWEQKSNADDGDPSFKRIYQDVRFIMSAIKECDSIQELGDIVTDEIRKLSGFEWVLFYQFDKDWNGRVISENKIEEMDSYLGLQFPASDIPKPARDLYLNNPFRLIPDRDYIPVKLAPVINPITHSFTDLSECNLRSVPKVHIEYMGNMGIKASMSTPIIVDKKLWGLISCHHREPKFLTFELKAAFELLSEIISVQIAAKEREAYLKRKSNIHKINLQLLEQIYEKNDFIEGLLKGDSTILDLLDASGAAICYDDKISTLGQTPSDDQVENLIDWLERYDTEPIFATNALPSLYRNAREIKDKCSGVLKIKLGTGEKDVILCFRGEVIQNVTWGGNPNEAINFDADNKNYHPRNSFEMWKETVEYTSLPWDPLTIEGAKLIRNAVLEKVLKEHV